MSDDVTTNNGEETPPEPVNLSPEEATKVIDSAVGRLQRQWLHIAVNIANAHHNGKAVRLEAYQDLRRLREQCEELQKARVLLSNIAKIAASGADEDNASKD